MSKPLRFMLAMLFGCLLAGCATQPGSRSASIRKTGVERLSKIRTTAYTHTETGGRNNAVGIKLSGDNVFSAAADWSRFPLGTRFRIVDTDETFEIDDYGSALVGTNTIDLYKTNRLAMRHWGVRHVDIDILAWGSNERSLAVLAPRAHHRLVRRMVVALREKTDSHSSVIKF